MEEYIKASEAITNKIVQELKSVTDFNDWAEHIIEKMQIIGDLRGVLKEKSSETQSKHDSAQAEKNTLEAALDVKQNELSKLKQECALIQNRCKNYHNENEKQIQLCIESQKHRELSASDKQTLHLAREKYEVYKKITNLIWDYTVPSNSVASGYVVNKSKSYIKPFMIKKQEVTHEHLVETLWKEIQIGAQKDCSDMIEYANENQENIIDN